MHSKKIFIAALTAQAVVACCSGQSQVNELWDMQFNGNGDPRDVGFTGHSANSSAFNRYDKFTNFDVMPGWMTASGNPGGYFDVDPEDRNTRAGGWTAEWRLAVQENQRGLALNFNDDTGLVKVMYDEPANTITLEDYLIGLEGNTQSVTAPVDLDNRAEHTYRLVRQPGSPTVELYIDNDPVAAASITPWPAADHGDAAQLNRVIFAHSALNAAWDFFRYHRGATVPASEQKTKVPRTRGLPGKARDGYQTYIIRPAINNDAILEGQPLPAVCRDETIMKIMCARGEYEPASFLIRTDRPLKQVMVRVGRLKNKAGRLPREAVDVRIARKFYRPITWQCLTMPWVLVHDPGMWEVVVKQQKWVSEITEESWKSPGGHSLAEFKAGYSRMNQLNRKLVDTDQLQPGDVQDFRQFWLTIHIPDDARPGTYRAPVTISAKNAPRTKLTLEVTVPEFDLLPPKFEYSVYHPTFVLDDTMGQGFVDQYHPLTEQQFLTELRNMVAHGCMNPCIYGGVNKRPDGTLGTTKIQKILALREKAGMGPGLPLYMMNSVAEPVSRVLTEEQKSKRVQGVRKVVAWGKKRGYPDIYWMAADEASGATLRAERDSFQAIRDGGGKTWVACSRGFFEIIGDLLDVPVFAHPGAQAVDQLVQWQVDPLEWLLHPERTPNWDPQILLTPGYQRIIEGVHKNGLKIFTYFDPQGGQPFPQYHRRHRGMGLWKIGLDGTMTWAYVHIGQKAPSPDDQAVKDNGMRLSPNSFVLRSPAGPLDTLSWEGYREGYDDARYLATLQDAIAKAKAKHADFAAETQRWLDNITVDADLDAWRLEMARRTETLLKP